MVAAPPGSRIHAIFGEASDFLNNTPDSALVNKVIDLFMGLGFFTPNYGTEGRFERSQQSGPNSLAGALTFRRLRMKERRCLAAKRRFNLQFQEGSTANWRI